MILSKKRYSPRLKKSILTNKCFAPISKNLGNLKKFKWQLFLRSYTKKSQLVRNDLFLVESKLFDLQKSYKNELLFKQKFFSFFNTLKKRAFKRLFKPLKTIQPRRFFINSFLCNIEFRLDIILFRANFVLTIHQARILIHSGFVYVNSRIVTTASYCLNVGDFIEVRTKKDLFSFNQRTFNLPLSFLEVNFEIFSIVLVDIPQRKDIPKMYPFFFNFNDLKFSLK